MKKTQKKLLILTLISLLLFSVISTCFAAFVPLTLENLTSSFENIQTESNSAVSFELSDNKVSLNYNTNAYSFDYNQEDISFIKQVTFDDDKTETIKAELLTVLYGYIAASNVQGKTINDSTDYIISEIKSLDSYIKRKLVDEGNSSNNLEDVSDNINLSNLLSSNLFDNLIIALSTHNSGDINYSDGNTFSLTIEKTPNASIIATLKILDNDFNSVSGSKSMSFNLSSMVQSQSSNSESSSVSNETTTPESSPSKSDNTVSTAKTIPQTGRSYTLNNIVVFGIITTFIIIIGMLTYDFRKNKKN